MEDLKENEESVYYEPINISRYKCNEKPKRRLYDHLEGLEYKEYRVWQPAKIRSIANSDGWNIHPIEISILDYMEYGGNNYYVPKKGAISVPNPIPDCIEIIPHGYKDDEVIMARSFKEACYKSIESLVFEGYPIVDLYETEVEAIEASKDIIDVWHLFTGEDYAPNLTREDKSLDKRNFRNILESIQTSLFNQIMSKL